MAYLQPVATADAPHRYRQDELREAAAQALPSSPGTDRLLATFDNARIDSRAFAVDLEWLLAPHGYKDRMEVYATVGLSMAEQASRKALAAAGMDGADLDGIVFVTTTGLAAPSLEARLANRMGWPASMARVPVWGLGCAGGVAGLARAGELADARRGRILLVALELCSLHFDVAKALGVGGAGGGDKKAIIAASLFADGCAAVVLDSRPTGLRIASTRSHLFADSERVMGWDVLDGNLDVVLAPDLPELVQANLPGVVDDYLDGQRPAHWVMHPGGAKVMDAYARGLGLGEGDLQDAATVLRRNGNMSSPTVLHVLAEAQRRKAQGSLLMAALGPGFAGELALLEAA